MCLTSSSLVYSNNDIALGFLTNSFGLFCLSTKKLMDRQIYSAYSKRTRNLVMRNHIHTYLCVYIVRQVNVCVITIRIHYSILFNVAYLDAFVLYLWNTSDLVS